MQFYKLVSCSPALEIVPDKTVTHLTFLQVQRVLPLLWDIHTHKVEGYANFPVMPLLQLAFLRGSCSNISINGGAARSCFQMQPFFDLDFYIPLKGVQDDPINWAHFEQVLIYSMSVDFASGHIREDRCEEEYRKRANVCFRKRVLFQDQTGQLGKPTGSLLSFGSVEYKFVEEGRARRQYVFSIDSIHINLDPLLDHFLAYLRNLPIINFDGSVTCIGLSLEQVLIDLEGGSTQILQMLIFPWINCFLSTYQDHPLPFESLYGDCEEAGAHVEEALLFTPNPEEIDGIHFKYVESKIKGFVDGTILMSHRMAMLGMAEHERMSLLNPMYLETKVKKYLDAHFIEPVDRISFVAHMIINMSTCPYLKSEQKETFLKSLKPVLESMKMPLEGWLGDKKTILETVRIAFKAGLPESVLARLERYFISEDAREIGQIELWLKLFNRYSCRTPKKAEWKCLSMIVRDLVLADQVAQSINGSQITAPDSVTYSVEDQFAKMLIRLCAVCRKKESELTLLQAYLERTPADVMKRPDLMRCLYENFYDVLFQEPFCQIWNTLIVPHADPVVLEELMLSERVYQLPASFLVQPRHTVKKKAEGSEHRIEVIRDRLAYIKTFNPVPRTEPRIILEISLLIKEWETPPKDNERKYRAECVERFKAYFKAAMAFCPDLIVKALTSLPDSPASRWMKREAVHPLLADPMPINLERARNLLEALYSIAELRRSTDVHTLSLKLWQAYAESKTEPQKFAQWIVFLQSKWPREEWVEQVQHLLAGYFSNADSPDSEYFSPLILSLQSELDAMIDSGMTVQISEFYAHLLSGAKKGAEVLPKVWHYLPIRMACAASDTDCMAALTDTIYALSTTQEWVGDLVFSSDGGFNKMLHRLFRGIPDTGQNVEAKLAFLDKAAAKNVTISEPLKMKLYAILCMAISTDGITDISCQIWKRCLQLNSTQPDLYMNLLSELMPHIPKAVIPESEIDWVSDEIGAYCHTLQETEVNQALQLGLILHVNLTWQAELLAVRCQHQAVDFGTISSTLNRVLGGDVLNLRQILACLLIIKKAESEPLFTQLNDFLSSNHCERLNILLEAILKAPELIDFTLFKWAYDLLGSSEKGALRLRWYALGARVAGAAKIGEVTTVASTMYENIIQARIATPDPYFCEYARAVFAFSYLAVIGEMAKTDSQITAPYGEMTLLNHDSLCVYDLKDLEKMVGECVEMVERDRLDPGIAGTIFNRCVRLCFQRISEIPEGNKIAEMLIRKTKSFFNDDARFNLLQHISLTYPVIAVGSMLSVIPATVDTPPIIEDALPEDPHAQINRIARLQAALNVILRTGLVGEKESIRFLEGIVFVLSPIFKGLNQLPDTPSYADVKVRLLNTLVEFYSRLRPLFHKLLENFDAVFTVILPITSTGHRPFVELAIELTKKLLALHYVKAAARNTAESEAKRVSCHQLAQAVLSGILTCEDPTIIPEVSVFSIHLKMNYGFSVASFPHAFEKKMYLSTILLHEAHRRFGSKQRTEKLYGIAMCLDVQALLEEGIRSGVLCRLETSRRDELKDLVYRQYTAIWRSVFIARASLDEFSKMFTNVPGTLFVPVEYWNKNFTALFDEAQLPDLFSKIFEAWVNYPLVDDEIDLIMATIGGHHYIYVEHAPEKWFAQIGLVFHRIMTDKLLSQKIKIKFIENTLDMIMAYERAIEDKAASFIPAYHRLLKSALLDFASKLNAAGIKNLPGKYAAIAEKY